MGVFKGVGMKMRKVELKGKVMYKGRRRGNKMGRVIHMCWYFSADYISRHLTNRNVKKKTK